MSATLVMLALSTALAGHTIEGPGGDYRVSISDCGTWNWDVAGEGLVIRDGGSRGPREDVSAAGAAIAITYSYDGVQYAYEMRGGAGPCDWQVTLEEALPSRFRAVTPHVEVTKVEKHAAGISGGNPRWEDFFFYTHVVGFQVRNITTQPIDDLQVAFSVNPTLGGAATDNQVQDTYSWGYHNLASASPVTGGITVGLTLCDDLAEVGFIDPGQPVFGTLQDPGGTEGDLEMVWRTSPVSMLADAIITPRLVVALSSATPAPLPLTNRQGTLQPWVDFYSQFNDLASACLQLDRDSDGVLDSRSGGDDCNDNDPFFGGASRYLSDADLDGYADPDTPLYVCGLPAEGMLPPGSPVDCDDSDAAISPDAIEIAVNGVDDNCDGLFGCWRDSDGDGWGTLEVVEALDPRCLGAGESDEAGDCDDSDPDVAPGRTERPGSGLDVNCDGLFTCWADGDGDGFGGAEVTSSAAGCDGEGETARGGDCDDAAAGVNPDAVEIPGNGVDDDCVDGDAEDEEVDDPEPGPEDGCACSAGASPSGGAMLILLVGLLRRRRQS